MLHQISSTVLPPSLDPYFLPVDLPLYAWLNPPSGPISSTSSPLIVMDPLLLPRRDIGDMLEKNDITAAMKKILNGLESMGIELRA